MFKMLTMKLEDSGNKADEESLPEFKNLPFKVDSTIDGKTLCVKIQGRMDTITAPELLEEFKKVEGKVDAIKIDVSNMAYVSSAGLRVLLIMYKAIDDKSRFEMTGVRPQVKEIFEATGFDQFLL
ncbi:MAG: STAS domain-containing protein [Ruminococcus sp.]|nr:STAS domain-containing protein [Ruminococcus sp.]